MLQNLMQHVGATEYVVAALLLFVAVFLSVVGRELMRPARQAQRLSTMPLDDETQGHPGAPGQAPDAKEREA